MRLLARSPHRYYHRAQQQLYLFSAGEIKDVPDEVGQLLLDAHPDRFALVEVEEGTDTSLGTGLEAPPHDRAVRRPRRSRRVSKTETVGPGGSGLGGAA